MTKIAAAIAFGFTLAMMMGYGSPNTQPGQKALRVAVDQGSIVLYIENALDVDLKALGID
jgi:hypothetical protein